MKEGDKVDLIIGKQTPLGYVVLIEEEDEGLLYSNEIFTTIKTGDRIIGYIKKIREDGRIDISLTPQGFKNSITIFSTKILEELRRHDGFLAVTDNSSPEEIKERLNMSKKSFKKAVGSLYKQKKIKIADDGIYLIKK